MSGQPTGQEVSYQYVNITAAAPTTTEVKAGKGVLHAIVINKAAANAVITLYDNTAASGTKIGTITLPATLLSSQDALQYDVAFGTGLTIVTETGACDLTVAFR